MARQFVQMTRVRIEGLLAAFPKLVNSGRQHTYVETENVRYVYQPLEQLYLLLVTNKQSNIMEDLDTLRLLGNVIPEYVEILDEEGISHCAFDLIFAFDEVIALGHKEHTNAQQVGINLAMESHEEKLHKMIIQSKINETKDIMTKKAMEIDKAKLESKMEGRGGGMGPGGLPASMGTFADTGGRGGGRDMDDAPQLDAPRLSYERRPTKPSGPSRGMKLGKKSASLLDEFKSDAYQVEEPQAAVQAGPAEALSLILEEKVTCYQRKDGGMDGLEVQGTMSLEVFDPATALVQVVTAQGNNPGFQFKTHPNMNKQLYNSQGVLTLKDPSRPFPTNSSLGVLKWRYQTREEDQVPLVINCWPSPSGSETYINIEYEATDQFDLHNVQILVPVPSADAPTVNSMDDGDYRFDRKNCCLIWELPLIEASNRSGAMEFVTVAADAAAFFPIEVAFTSPKTFCDIAVEGVVRSEDGSKVDNFRLSTTMATDRYVVE